MTDPLIDDATVQMQLDNLPNSEDFIKLYILPSGDKLTEEQIQHNKAFISSLGLTYKQEESDDEEEDT